MKASKMIKRILQAMVLSIALLVGVVSLSFFICMGKLYGYKDIGGTDYLGSQAFSNILEARLQTIEGDIQVLDTIDLPQMYLTLYYWEYNSANGLLELQDKQYVSRDTVMKEGAYQYEYMEDTELEVRPEYIHGFEEEYEPAWYAIGLKRDAILKQEIYSVMSKQDYVNLALLYTNPNTINISMMEDEALLEKLTQEGYHIPEESLTFSEYEMMYSQGVLKEYLLEHSGGKLYLNENFGEDAYVGYIDGEIFVYSPHEERFYSGKYGWYLIPDELFFPAYDVEEKDDKTIELQKTEGDGIGLEVSEEIFDKADGLRKTESKSTELGESDEIDSKAVNLAGFDGLEVLMMQFTDRYTILEVRLGEDYLAYVQALMDLEYSNSNLNWYIIDEAGSGAVYKNVEQLEDITEQFPYIYITGGYRAVQGGGIEPYLEYEAGSSTLYNAYLEDAFRAELAESQEGNGTGKDSDNNSIQVYVGVNGYYPFDDSIQRERTVFQQFYRFMIPSLLLTAVSLFCFLGMLVSYTRKAGKESDESTGYPLGLLDRCPVELLLLTLLLGGWGLFSNTGKILSHLNVYLQYVVYAPRDMLWDGMIFFLIGILVFLAYLNLVRRIKLGVLRKYSVVHGFLYGIKLLVLHVAGQENLVLKAVELFLFYCFIMSAGLGLIAFDVFLAFTTGLSIGILSVAGILIIVITLIVILVVAIRKAKGQQAIREITKTLAEGNLGVEMPSPKTLVVEQQILNNIEHLSDGLQKAVEQSIYDERMKAELITNVSHDIKTPLTSIINYVDLMKRESIENEKVLHYIEVLDQKSHRLKQLTEDLVEVSKISSGNIELECMPIDFGELVRQSIGEFEDKFAEHELQIIESISKEACMVYADGRRTFRVMDNLLQNIYKYAMPQTRVYIDLVKSGGEIQLSIKNISKAELNIDARELMERFVRGDQSRTTEGSGLGLSIAGDLIRIQGGRFDIQLDGDLFKVIIVFQEYVEEEEQKEAAK